jgi:hypothetical protein
MHHIQMRRPHLHSESSMKNVGRPVVIWPGWVTFDARYSPQTDINPLPIEPYRHASWPMMQPQLSNGWQQTNYGRRMSYDNYLTSMSSSASGPNFPKGKPPPPLPGQGFQPQGYASPSDIQLANQISLAAPPPSTVLQGGTGVLGPGVDLSTRRYYG